MAETSGLSKKRIQIIEQKAENLNSQLTSQGIRNRDQYEEALTELRQLIKEK